MKTRITTKLLAAVMCLAAMSFNSCGDNLENPEEGDCVTIKVKDDVNIDLVYVAPGEFRMGATSEQEGYDTFTELPVHNVTISKGYWIGKLEITQKQWLAVMGYNRSLQKVYENKPNDELPVSNITWAEATEFCKKISELSGKTFRLPTEAEWEYAARGASKTFGIQYSGSKYLDRIAVFKDNSNGQLHPVGQYMPNELDMRDMSGNVSEWVKDNFVAYKDSAQVDPCFFTADSLSHPARGGSFVSSQTECRTASRQNYDSAYKSPFIGLRVVMEK